MRKLLALLPMFFLYCVVNKTTLGDESIIEKQLSEIGSVHNEEIVVVQRKYTRKTWRHEFTPLSLGGIPFGTIRRTLIAGANYNLHFNDSFSWQVINFIYSKNFFSGLIDDLNNIGNKQAGANPGQADIQPDIQKLIMILNTSVHWTPFYGKISTLGSWIVYIEPFFSFGAGISKTETSNYLTFAPGIGVRAFFREWVSMRLEFLDYIYTEKFLTRTSPSVETSALRHNYAVMLSLSFWLPKMPR